MKTTLTGTITRELVNRGSKSERMAILLRIDAHRTLFIRVKGGNAMYDDALEPFIGKRVSIVGYCDMIPQAIFIDSLADIRPATSTFRPPKP